MPRRNAPLIALGIALVAIAIAATYFWFHQTALREAETRGNSAIGRLSTDLMVSVEKFEHLPYLVGAEQMLTKALEFPNDPERIAAANRYLVFAQERTDVAAVFLMDIQGRTLAASNWNLASSFVGRNYRFRPYFQDALRGETGRFYAVGVTTGEPGFFIAAPIRSDARVIGVVTVKINLNAFEDRWHAENLRLALLDDKGVIFLTTEARWRYRSLYPLSAAVATELQQTLQYGQVTPTALMEMRGALPGPELQKIEMGDASFLVQGRTLERFGWQLLLFSDPALPRAQGLRAAEFVGMGLAVLLLITALLWQYRRRMDERKASVRERAQVVAELEQRIASRTAELTAANDAAVHAGKLVLLGQMAASISHEISQPLTALRTLADNASKFLERQDTTNTGNNLRLMGELCLRMGNIIGELKAFARNEPARLQAIPLKNVISSSLMLIEPLRQSNQTLIVHNAIDLWVMGDPIRLEQVLVNLLRNGIDAMEMQPERKIDISSHETADGMVCVSVQDRGPGLSTDVQQHLFEPFFTTKPSGKGLGLGLALSKAIVTEMGGRIEAMNTHPGARFDIYLHPATHQSEALCTSS
jgi:two-component system, NtrC family, C4-dicarboxylate transport sensor histidine kinase DctB